MPGEGAGVGVEVQWLLAGMQRRPQAAADIDLLQWAARVQEPAHQALGFAQRLIEGRQFVAEHPVRQVEVRRVDGEIVPRGDLEGAVQVLLVDAELGRTGAAVEALRVPAHHTASGSESRPLSIPRSQRSHQRTISGTRSMRGPGSDDRRARSG